MDNSKKDTGLRVNANGTIRVKKSVFFARKDVKNIVSKMKTSQAYPKTAK